jgi:hypothetical protein
MARRMRETHAKMRLSQRTSVGSFERLRRAVKEGHFSFLRRQSCTRSLCRAAVDGEEIYFVLNRQRGTIITVLTEDQALSWIQNYEQGQASGENQGNQAC